MQKCRAAGYEVTLVFVATAQAEINVARVAGRVRQGGHAVPEDRIRERYRRSLDLLPRVVEEADRAFVFDSTPEQQTRLCFQKLIFEAPLNPPPYLQARLVLALRQRRAERAELTRQFGPTALPDEESGESAGPIRALLSQYAVQETTAGVLLRHDRLLSAGPFLPGQTIRLRYKEGVGSQLSEDADDKPL